MERVMEEKLKVELEKEVNTHAEYSMSLSIKYNSPLKILCIVSAVLGVIVA